MRINPFTTVRTQMCGILTGDFALTAHGCAMASSVEVPLKIKGADSSFDWPAGDLLNKGY